MHAFMCLALALPAAESSRTDVPCTGNSTKLPADQCAAWQEFYDSTGGDNWTNEGRQCTRNDPCDIHCYQTAALVCNKARTTVLLIDLGSSNLVGTIPASVGAWVDLIGFDVHDNQLTGPVPATATNWKNLQRGFFNQFSVLGNKLTGPLPDLDFDKMTFGCVLLHDQPTNNFSCPWPKGVTTNCHKDPGGYVTDADCHGS